MPSQRYQHTAKTQRKSRLTSIRPAAACSPAASAAAFAQATNSCQPPRSSVKPCLRRTGPAMASESCSSRALACGETSHPLPVIHSTLRVWRILPWGAPPLPVRYLLFVHSLQCVFYREKMSIHTPLPVRYPVRYPCLPCAFLHGGVSIYPHTPPCKLRHTRAVCI